MDSVLSSTLLTGRIRPQAALEFFASWRLLARPPELQFFSLPAR